MREMVMVIEYMYVGIFCVERADAIDYVALSFAPFSLGSGLGACHTSRCILLQGNRLRDLDPLRFWSIRQRLVG